MLVSSAPTPPLPTRTITPESTVRTSLGLAIGNYQSALKQGASGTGSYDSIGTLLIVAALNTGVAQDAFQEIFPGSELSQDLREDSSKAAMTGGFLRATPDTAAARAEFAKAVAPRINDYLSHALDAVAALKSAPKA